MTANTTPLKPSPSLNLNGTKRNVEPSELQALPESQTAADLPSTDRDAYSQSLRKREMLLASAAKIARLGWWNYDIVSGRLEWSDETIEIFGLTRETFGGQLKDFLALVHPADVGDLVAQHGRNLTTNEAGIHEYRIRRPDGEERFIWDRGETIFGTDGKPARRCGVVVDITERKVAETEILKLSAAVEQAPDRILITDRRGRIEYVNPAFERATGYEARDVVGRTPAVLKSGAHGHEFYAKLWQTISRGESFHAEFINKRRDGGTVIEEQTITPLRNRRGEITHFVSTGRDISERKRTEATLRGSEERHRLLFESNPQAAWVFDLETLKFLAVNPAALTLYGYSAEEFLGMTLKEIRPEEDIPKLMAFCAKRNAIPASPVNLGLTRHKLKDGRIIDVEIRAHQITYAGRAAAMVLPVDVTERRKAEQSLRESEARFRQLAENVKEVFWIQDVDSKQLLYVSPAFERVWGRSCDSLVTSEDWLSTIHAEDRAGVVEYLKRQQSEGCFEHTYRIVRPDGTVRRIHNRAYPICEEWRPKRIVGTAEDITDRFVAEEARAQSEERFRLLSKATNDAVWDWDVTADRIWWSEGCESLFGFNPDDVQRGIDAWVNRIHPEDRELTKAELNKALERTDSTWEAQYRLLRRDGSFAWVLDRAHLIRNGEGRAIRMIGGMSDITERKEQEARITEQATLLDIAHEAIVVKDLSHKVLYWNKGAARIFGWTTEEAIGGQTSNLFHSDATQLERATKTVLDAGEWHGDLSAKRKDGTAITISARWTLVRTNNGEPKSIFSIMSDVTESRKMEKQLLRAQRMESIGTLAGGIAHDLNNVLAPIMMSIEMLKDEVKDAAGRSMLDAIESSARHGAELVKQVLGFARGMDGDRVLINPAHVARDIQRIIRDTFPKNIVLSLSVPKGIWCMKGDATQLHQVLMNLCVNARDAMPNGGRLDISLKNVVLDDVFASQHPHAQKGPHIQITVTDTGLGINKEDLERIFEPFFTTKPTGQGTGLGLSTTLAIVKSHGGFVDVLTELGRGSSFNIYLPAVSGNSADDKAERVTKLPKGNGESILVVDDERSLREIAKATLERNGYRVVLAANGAEAVATYARDPRISLALVDMNMPVMDGAATIAALRQLNPDLGIIASSGVSSSNGCAIPLSAAANRFIAKPYTAEALLISIGETIAGACQQN